MRSDVIAAIERVSRGRTEKGGRTLALCRGLVGYVLAADLVDLPPEIDIPPFATSCRRCARKSSTTRR
jgi:hypothetical protein